MIRKSKPHGFSTLAVHGGEEPREADTPVVQPIYQSVNYVQEIGTAKGLRYPRCGNTPNSGSPAIGLGSIASHTPRRAVFSGSEATPEHCHRRLVAERIGGRGRAQQVCALRADR